MSEITSSLAAPMYALPVDLFRVLAGCVVLWYFICTLRQTTELTLPDDLIDHGLLRRSSRPRCWAFSTRGCPAGCTGPSSSPRARGRRA